jgi:uncharacterized membrane protein
MTAKAQPARKAGPVINSLTIADTMAALRAGVGDFAKAPLFGLFFGGVFALGGLLMYVLLNRFNAPWLIIPLAIGFPLIGPFAAVGLYEVSRRIAGGEPLEWKSILGVVLRQRERELSWMAFVVLFVFWIWVYQVRLLMALFLAFKRVSTLDAFISAVTSTSEGWSFLATGTVVGAILALVLFSVTVIAIPMLMEREVDFVTAIATSVSTVLQNKVAMLSFAGVVTMGAFAGLLPLFLGLPFIMPVLGHATWHLYKKAIA